MYRHMIHTTSVYGCMKVSVSIAHYNNITVVVYIYIVHYNSIAVMLYFGILVSMYSTVFD